MKVSTWLGVILLLLALVAAYFTLTFEDDDPLHVPAGPAAPGTIELRVATSNATKGQFGRFVSGAAEILARELEINVDVVMHLRSSFQGGLTNSRNSSEISCAADQFDLSVVEPALYGLAIDAFDWTDGECQVLVRLCNQAAGVSRSRDLVRRDGRIMWVDSPPVP